VDISIVMPVFNEEAFLKEALMSLLTQSYPIKELIIVDDGSTDNSVTIANSIAKKYAFIKVVLPNGSTQHQPGQKVTRAFERGFSALSASWDVICKFDADLIFPKNYVETLANAFSQNPNLGMYGGVLHIKKNESFEFESIAAESHLRGPIKAYRKDCFEAIGGLRPALGWDTLDEILALRHGFLVETDKKLVVKHLRPTGANYSQRLSKAKGKMFYQFGYGCVLGVLACIKWAAKERGNPFGALLGFFGAWLTRKPKLVSSSEATFIRKHRWLQVRRRFIS
jgi:glycosyltransferase involved in cell wall biosynthesis